MIPPFKRTQDTVTIFGGATRIPLFAHVGKVETCRTCHHRHHQLRFAGRELWGLNAMWQTDELPWTRWFNLHRLKHLDRDWKEGLAQEMAWVKRHPDMPFYVIRPWPRVPSSLAFPLAKLRTLPRGGRYHAGSFDMLAAFAIWLGFKRIEFYGIHLSHTSEPISARACLEYWLGVAEGRGIQTYVHPDCDLFAQYHLVKSRTVYGYDDVKLIETRG